MTTHLGQYNFISWTLDTGAWTTFRESGKMVPYMCHFNRLYTILWNDQWTLLIFGTQLESRRLLHFVQQTGIVRFFLLFEQYGVKILITSVWDTQYKNFKDPMVVSPRVHIISRISGWNHIIRLCQYFKHAFFFLLLLLFFKWLCFIEL